MRTSKHDEEGQAQGGRSGTGRKVRHREELHNHRDIETNKNVIAHV